MCGGIVGALSASAASPAAAAAPNAANVANVANVANSARTVIPIAVAQPARPLTRVLAYNAGRISSYMVAGALAGGLASGAQSLSALAGVQLGFYWLANLMLVALGLYLMNAWQGLALLEQGGRVLWQAAQPAIAPVMKSLMPATRPHQAYILGALWGWLPCGMVYSVLLTAMLSGSATNGAAVMLAFGLGTLPMLTGLGLLGARLQRALQRPPVRLACGLLVLAFGLLGLPAEAAPAAGAVAAAASKPAGCYHCGLPVPANAKPEWKVHIAGADQAMCCPGCTAVAQTIMDLGQESYYLNRSEYAATAEGAQVLPPELQLYDNADPRFVCRDNTSERETTLAVDGIRCAACVWLIEQRLNQLPGVASAQLNVATERLYVRWRSDDCRPGDILAALHTIGYSAYPYDAARHSVQQQQAQRTLGRQLFVAGLSMMQVMMYVAPAYMAQDGTLDENMAQLMRWASLLLTAPAIFYSALPFWRGAWASLRARALGMDVPVALGIAAAFGASVLATFQGGGEVYYDSVTMFIFLLLCSRYLELRARRKAGAALERLQHALPTSATVLADYPASQQATLVKAAALEVDQVIMIKPGEAVAADCVILQGRTALDLSLLSGESVPIPKQEGDQLPGGAINASNMIIARVTQRVQDSTLSNLVKLIDRAGRDKPRIAQWADDVAAWFVLALLLFAVATFGFWFWLDGYNASRAWPIAIAVLVVSCPCALSLATPTALAAGTDRLLRQGVLVTGAQTLETLHRATHIVFDKTGTLTMGKPKLTDTVMLGDVAVTDLLSLAAALERGSEHPLAEAIVEGADAQGASRQEATGFEAVTGKGVRGKVKGRA
eukprot:gene7536-7366_t